jgi:hypothetical protein
MYLRRLDDHLGDSRRGSGHVPERVPSRSFCQTTQAVHRALSVLGMQDLVSVHGSIEAALE